MEAALVSLLLSDVALTTLTDQRVHPMFLPQQSALPAVTYQRISDARHHAHDGESRLQGVRVQFNCYAERYSEAKDVARFLQAAVRDFRGVVDGVEFSGIDLQGERDDYHPERDLQSVQVDAMIWHRRSLDG